ncbi:MAG: CAP domain-containing protein, partial [Microcoleus sp.]|uniref:CAP domain-containing protein n=1 Tax=Microcoleus sp. TaxID=44472 RepID=UPI003C75E2D6
NCANLTPVRSPEPNLMNTNLASSSLPDLEKAVNQQINQYRASKNLPPLSVDPRITQQARIHSQNMASGKVKFSHEGFEGRVKAISIPYQSVAENVAYNMGYSDPVRNAVEGWIKSEGHRKNIEGQFNLTGIGIAKNAKGEYYFTQIFVLSR